MFSLVLLIVLSCPFYGVTPRRRCGSPPDMPPGAPSIKEYIGRVRRGGRDGHAHAVSRWTPRTLKGLHVSKRVPSTRLRKLGYVVPISLGILARKGRQIFVVPAQAGTQSLPLA